jgi:hypothetical protein
MSGLLGLLGVWSRTSKLLYRFYLTSNLLYSRFALKQFALSLYKKQFAFYKAIYKAICFTTYR